MTEKTASTSEAVALTADIVAAYLSNNNVVPGELPELISSVHAALTRTDDPTVAEPAKREPVVSIKKSVTPDHIISLLDGKKYKSLKRHLASQQITPDEYRAEFNLPKDYPMVAASYSAHRSALAKSLGLGRRAAAADAPKATREEPA